VDPGSKAQQRACGRKVPAEAPTLPLAGVAEPGQCFSDEKRARGAGFRPLSRRRSWVQRPPHRDAVAETPSPRTTPSGYAKTVAFFTSCYLC
jgi:hypothetical protein